MQKIIYFLMALCYGFMVQAQSEQLIVPLTNPDSPGKFIFNNYKGSVDVTGYDGAFVIINATYGNPGNQSSSNAGLQRIQVNNFQISAEENNNVVLLSCECKGKTVHFDIKLPHTFSVQIKTYENATISVNNISGVIEADNLNGDVVLTNISGSAVVSTIDGNIQASFTEVDYDSPMAFTSIEGDIELKLPELVNATLKMKTQSGEVFSDFEVVIEKRIAKIKKESQKSVISLDEWVLGKINGGGPEYLIKSHNGNILVKKNK